MGGEREQILDAGSAAKSSKLGGSITLGKGEKIRIHENKGEVHFHDDKTKLKVAVPTDRFWTEWQKFNPAKKKSSIFFHDPINNTVAIIESFEPDFQSGKVTMDVSVRIEKAQLGDNLKKLTDFATGK